LRYSPDGSYLAAASNDGHLRVLNPSNGALINEVQTEEEWGTICVDYSPDGKVIAAGGRDHKIRFYEAASLELLGHISLPNWAAEVAFSPDGERILTGGTDHSVRLWDRGSGDLLLTLPVANYWTMSAAFAPDGRTIAAANHDVFVWRADAELKASNVGTRTTDPACIDVPDQFPSHSPSPLRWK
jgi:WD40 repeat protein